MPGPKMDKQTPRQWNNALAHSVTTRTVHGDLQREMRVQDTVTPYLGLSQFCRYYCRMLEVLMLEELEVAKSGIAKDFKL